jgi:hypothetical protein
VQWVLFHNEDKRGTDNPGKLGIHEDDHVVLYDTLGVFSSPRGLFTFKGELRNRLVHATRS